ncbi:hypothetical protein I551_2138 [Mycobacterium ulcerans str. Harvey]|uniref:Uncharacterized protein n=1 Tax=Mycobacterium ulcerans str. Harvey TaxID=1299332 RepID=A0ABP3AP32_MYCUL|nr:hypothetical protein I551_2138 [Mycobacterium ulcerans str. Harvey]
MQTGQGGLDDDEDLLEVVMAPVVGVLDIENVGPDRGSNERNIRSLLSSTPS